MLESTGIATSKGTSDAEGRIYGGIQLVLIPQWSALTWLKVGNFRRHSENLHRQFLACRCPGRLICFLRTVAL
jgi:hypothetical protein